MKIADAYVVGFLVRTIDEIENHRLTCSQHPGNDDCGTRDYSLGEVVDRLLPADVRARISAVIDAELVAQRDRIKALLPKLGVNIDATERTIPTSSRLPAVAERIDEIAKHLAEPVA